MDKISHYFFNLELVRPYLPQLFDGFLITLLMAGEDWTAEVPAAPPGGGAEGRKKGNK